MLKDFTKSNDCCAAAEEAEAVGAADGAGTTRGAGEARLPRPHSHTPV